MGVAAQLKLKLLLINLSYMSQHKSQSRCEQNQQNHGQQAQEQFLHHSDDKQQIQAQNEHYADQLKESNVHSVISHRSSPQDLLKIFKQFEPASNFINMAQIHASLNLKLKRYKEAVYYGELLQGKRHGKGILLYQNIRVYEGSWQCDYKHGQGYQKFSNSCTYEGDYVNGKPEGVGKYVWPNGQFYEGEWVGGQKQGSGMWRGSKGDSYIGEWKSGKADGYGVHTWVNGDRYEGEFKDCLKHGEGIQKFANGDLYRGSYQRGKPSGFGEYYWANGSYFKGQFVDGLRDGQGLWKRGTGNSDKYEGAYKGDKKDGYGIFTWSTGNIYKGNYEADMRNGYGQMYWRDGSFYKGNWQRGVQHGDGEVYVPGEGYKKGIFQENVLIVMEKQSKGVPEHYPRGLDPQKSVQRNVNKKKINLPPKGNFRSRDISTKKGDRRSRSIDQNNVVRFGGTSDIKNHPLLPKRFTQSRDQRNISIDKKTIKPPKNQPNGRILHSSFYMHKLHNDRANTSINGSRAEAFSGYSVTRQRNRRQMMLEMKTLNKKKAYNRELHSDFD